MCVLQSISEVKEKGEGETVFMCVGVSLCVCVCVIVKDRPTLTSLSAVIRVC